MEAEQQPRKCLICSAPIAECRMGIDSCRACAVFYKRISSAKRRRPVECTRGDEKCVEIGAVTACRKCRFERITKILNKALVSDYENYLDISQDDLDPIQIRSIECARRMFIDHTTFMLDQPSCSTTPLFDKIRFSYSLMCQTLKSGETGTKSATFQLSKGDYEGSKINFVPVTYGMVLPNAGIFVAALYDFAKMTFPDFTKLESTNKGLCISENLHFVTLVEATYRAAHHFPHDLNTHFASYTTIVNEELIQHFLDDCPFATNKQEAIEALRVNMKRAKSMSREFYHRVQPDNIEFTALLGLAFWNNGVAYANEELSIVVQKNRSEIMKELHEVYKTRGMKDYAGRLGELFCLLDNMEEAVTLSKADIEVYRLHNLFNECCPLGAHCVLLNEECVHIR